MSTTAPMNERTVTATLLSLWRRGAHASMEALLRDTLAPLPDVRQALEMLTRRGCVMERQPAGALTLERTGLPCWRDVIEGESQRLGRRLGRRALVYHNTGSTNDVCWQQIGPDVDGLVVLADRQTAGRGRRGNTWHARGGQSVLGSIVLLRPAGTPQQAAEALTLLTGLAVAEALEEVTPARTSIKWPNDVLVDGKKIAGVLVEARAGEIPAAVVGIGINVAEGTRDFVPELRERATSCYLVSGMQIDRLRLIEALLTRVNARLGQMAEPALWLDAWKQRCRMLGQEVALRCDGQIYRGRVADVDPLQGLILRDEQGMLRHFAAQVTSVERG